MTVSAECDELRIHIERLRALLDSLVVRGLRACGPDELAQLGAHTEHLERSGAAHVAAALAELRAKIEKDDRGSARALLKVQAAVRLLERLLTLRVVRAEFAAARQRAEAEGAGPPVDSGCPEEDADEEDEA